MAAGTFLAGCRKGRKDLGSRCAATVIITASCWERTTAKGRQRSCAGEKHVHNQTWPGLCQHKPPCAQQDHLLFHAAGPSPSPAHIISLRQLENSFNFHVARHQFCCRGMLQVTKYCLILNHCGHFLLSHKLQIPKDAVHNFSKSSLKKQNKIRSWQRTLLSPSPALPLSMHLMLLAQKQYANSEAGNSLLFSPPPSNQPCPHQHPHGPTHAEPQLLLPKAKPAEGANTVGVQ